MEKVKVFAASSFKLSAKELAADVNEQIAKWQTENPNVKIINTELQTKQATIQPLVVGNWFNGYHCTNGSTEIVVAVLVRYEVKK
ncbi:MAG: hypothetical protein Q8P76_02820 [bacterium]|nr:hypothetical protein [bacterium]